MKRPLSTGLPKTHGAAIASHALPLHVVYVAASRRDARFTRICVASIRSSYPDIPIRIIAGGPLEPGLLDELGCHWGVEKAFIPDGDYGWGFVKLEPLFGPVNERFLVLDSDTILLGRVFDAWQDDAAPFLVDNELQAENKAKALYYDWDTLRGYLPQTGRPKFVFNSGQWFGTAGVLSRGDFDPVLQWSMPPSLRYPSCFMPGDQGVLNWVLNQKVAEGLAVTRRRIMHWPGHPMDGLSAAEVAAGRSPPLIVHWAGMKKARLGAMAGSDLLQHFEKLYYSRIRGGDMLRLARASTYASVPVRRRIKGGLAAAMGAFRVVASL